MNTELYEEIVEGIVSAVIEELGYEDDAFDVLSQAVSDSAYVMYFGEAKELIAYMDQQDASKVQDAYEETTMVVEETYDTFCRSLAYNILMNDVCEEYETVLESNRARDEDYE